MDNSISCRPKLPGQSPYDFTNFQVRSVTADLTGAAILTPFPLATRVGQIDFGGLAVGLVSLTLSTSLLNQVPLDTVAVFASIDVGPTLSANGAYAIFLTHLVRQNATAAQRFASSRSNSVSMGERSVYPLGSGVRLALYVSSAAAAGNEISAIFSAYWVPLGV